MVKRYTRKIPVSFFAVQWVNNNEEEIEEFIGDGVSYEQNPYNSSIDVYIQDSYGKECAEVGDYIVVDEMGEVFIWGRKAFEHYYKEVE